MLWIESVADAADVQNMPRSRRLGLELAPEADDVVVDHAIVERDVRAPGRIEQLVAREHAAAVADERSEQFEFERAELDNAIRAPHFAAGKIHFSIGETERPGCLARRAAAKVRLDPGAQLASG
jgi:hypothetical protein